MEWRYIAEKIGISAGRVPPRRVGGLIWWQNRPPAAQAPPRHPPPVPTADPTATAELERRIAAYSRPLEGARLAAPTLPELLRAEPLIVLHFMRHLGCIFCKHSVRELRKLAEGMRFPPIVFVHQSTVPQAEAFFEEYYPGAAHISDASLGLYQLFEIRRLEGLQVFNPSMYAVGVQSLLSGNRQGATQGDALVLSGTFLFRQGRLVWSHRAKYAGDDPKWSRLAGGA